MASERGYPVRGPEPIEQFERDVEAVIRRGKERIDSCHERRSCPKCGQPKGERCVKLSSRPFRSADPKLGTIPRVEAKHPHRERWQMEVPVR